MICLLSMAHSKACLFFTVHWVELNLVEQHEVKLPQFYLEILNFFMMYNSYLSFVWRYLISS